MAEQPDVAVILEALRQEVRARRGEQGDVRDDPALSAIERELHHYAEQLEITRVVSAHWPLEGKSLYERSWALVNKVVRRALRWYINPIVEQQNAFNDVAARSLRLLIEAHAELRDQLADLHRQGETPAPAPPASSANDDSAPDVAELQQQIERTGRSEPPAPLPDLAMRPFTSQLNDRHSVNAHWDLGGDNALTRARALAQRGIRQYLRWIINPIVEQQNAYNAPLAAATTLLLAVDGELRARVAAARNAKCKSYNAKTFQ